MAMDVEKYIKAHMYGNPTINPDDKREFLGNFRENVALALTVGQAAATEIAPLVKKAMAALPQGRMYINGRLPFGEQQELMQLAITGSYAFTIVTDSGVRVHEGDAGTKPGDMAVVVADPRGPLKKRLVL